MIRLIFLCIILSVSIPVGCAQNLDTAVESLIAQMIERTKSEDDSQGYYTAIQLADFGAAAVPLLVEGLNADNPSTRKWCARALTNIVGEYGDSSGRETAKSAGIPLLTAFAKEKDDATAWYLLQAIRSVQPQATRTMPVLRSALHDSGDPELQREIVSVIEGYGEDATGVKPVLIDLMATSLDDRFREVIMSAITRIGVTPEDAQRLSRIKFGEGSQAAVDVVLELFDYPPLAMQFLESHPSVFRQAYDESLNEQLLRLLKDTSPETRELRRYVRAREDLPALTMVFLGDSEFIPRIHARMEDASEHKRTFLKACARALGADADRVVRISADEPGDFRPKSAHPATDSERLVEDAEHGHGLSLVLITGHLVMRDGAPVREPLFIDTKNDRILLGKERSDLSPIANYDAKTGRFVLFASVFAAYAIAEGHEKPGPYQTGSVQVRIEGKGARPLTVSFYDEMPDVLITLDPVASKARLKKKTEASNQDGG